MGAATIARLMSVELCALTLQLAWADTLGFLSALVRIWIAARVSSRPARNPHTTDYRRVQPITRVL